jgi:hypothetical protein
MRTIRDVFDVVFVVVRLCNLVYGECVGSVQHRYALIHNSCKSAYICDGVGERLGSLGGQLGAHVP